MRELATITAFDHVLPSAETLQLLAAIDQRTLYLPQAPPPACLPSALIARQSDQTRPFVVCLCRTTEGRTEFMSVGPRDLRNRDPVQVPLDGFVIERVDIGRRATHHWPGGTSARSGQASYLVLRTKSSRRYRRQNLAGRQSHRVSPFRKKWYKTYAPGPPGL